jgi:hypothetical protein
LPTFFLLFFFFFNIDILLKFGKVGISHDGQVISYTATSP